MQPVLVAGKFSGGKISAQSMGEKLSAGKHATYQCKARKLVPNAGKNRENT